MIRPRYSLTLARTKLGSKRGMLIASIIVASILFAVLIAGVIVFTAAEKSALTFVKKAGNDKYLVRTRPHIPNSVYLYSSQLSSETIKEVRDYETKYYANLKAEYKKAGIEYDDSQETSALQPASWMSNDVPEDQRFMLNHQSPIIESLRAERLQNYLKTAKNSFEHLKKLGAKYNATGYYIEYQTSFPPIPQSRLITNGKEDFSAKQPKGGTPYEALTNSASNSYYQFKDNALLDRYLLTKDAAKLKGVPVVIAAQEAAALYSKSADIGKEPKDPSEKRAWLETVQKKLNGRTFEVCSRNSTELTMLEKIQRDYADIKNNQKNKDYVAPKLQYDYPKTACGDIIVKQDTRNQTEKAVEEKTIADQKKLGTYEPPTHQLTTFQIVGFMNARDYDNSNENIFSFVQNLLNPIDYTASAIVPLQTYDKMPEDLKFKDNISSMYDVGTRPEQTEQFAARVLEFPTIDNARTFLKKETCPEMESNCNKLYNAESYGSNYFLIDEIGKLFQKIIRIALPVMLALAFVIMWFTISRIMAENRKETAVYRAMGASRGDIAAIYITYVLLVASAIALVAFGLGIGAAYVIDQTYGAQLTDIALSSFGVNSAGMRFSLFDLSSPLLLGIFGMIIAVSLIASIQPLIRNVMRSPITDMREE